MKHYGLNIPEGSNITNITMPTGTADPIVGNAGELFFRTDTETVRYHDGTQWNNLDYTGTTVTTFEYTATAGQTIFTGSDDNGAVLAYNVNSLIVFLNGHALDTSDYIATNGTSITLNIGASLNDILMVLAYGVLQTTNADTLGGFSAGQYLRSDTSGTLTGTLTVTGNILVGGTLDMQTDRIVGVVDPVDLQDAATKNYVDTNGGGLFTETATFSISGGTGAGNALSSGIGNFIAGHNAGNDITSGDYNVVIGEGAGDKMTTCNDNIAIGRDAAGAVTNDGNLIAIGVNALGKYTNVFAGSGNVAIGSNAGSNHINRDGHVDLGHGAAQYIREGSFAVAIGQDAMAGPSATLSTNTADSSVAIGRNAMQSVTDGPKNVAIGGLCANGLTTGSENIVIGYDSANDLTTGIRNTVVGARAVSGTFATGSNNTVLGYKTGFNITANSANNILIGSNAGPQTSIEINDELYIDNSSTTTPLIHGNFSTDEVTINGSFTVSGPFGVGYIKDSNTSGSAATARLGFRDSANTNMGNVGFSNGTGTMQVSNQISGGNLELLCLGATSTVMIKHNSSDVVRSTSLANGGLEINNTVTGGGWERTLTTSDIGTDLGEFTVAGLPAAASNANNWALATNASGGRTVVRSDGTNWKVIAVEGATVTV